MKTQLMFSKNLKNSLKKIALSTAFCSLVFVPLSYGSQETSNNNRSLNSVTNDHLQAKQLLMKKLAEVADFSAHFEQKVSQPNGEVLQQTSGTLMLSKPNKIKWQTEQPESSLFVSDGKQLWFYDPFIEQATVYDLKKSIANTPLLLLSDNSATQWQHYEITQINGSTFSIVRKDNIGQIKQLTVQFKQNKLQKLLITDNNNGQLSEISLSNQTVLNPNKHSVEQLFTFKLPEGADLDDQR